MKKEKKKKVQAIMKIRNNPLDQIKERLFAHGVAKKKTKPSVREVRKIVTDSSPYKVKTWLGVRFLCPKCNSTRLELFINPEFVKTSTVTVEYKCRSCHWGAMPTYNLVYERG